MWHDMLIERGDKRWAGYVVNGSKETAEGFLKLLNPLRIIDTMLKTINSRIKNEIGKHMLVMA